MTADEPPSILHPEVGGPCDVLGSTPLFHIAQGGEGFLEEPRVVAHMLCGCASAKTQGASTTFHSMGAWPIRCRARSKGCRDGGPDVTLN